MMKRKVSVWQSLLAVLAVLLAVGGVYAVQWRKPEVQLVLNQPNTKSTQVLGSQEARLEERAQAAAQRTSSARK